MLALIAVHQVHFSPATAEAQLGCAGALKCWLGYGMHQKVARLKGSRD